MHYKGDLYVDQWGGIYQKRRTFYVEATCHGQAVMGALVAYAERLCTEWQILALGNPTENRNPLFAIQGWNYWWAGKLTKKQKRKLIEKNAYYKTFFKGGK